MVDFKLMLKNNEQFTTKLPTQFIWFELRVTGLNKRAGNE